MRTKKAQQLIDALEPAAEADGFELVDVEIAGKGSSPVIRIYLDGPQGIGLDELAQANKWIDRIVEEIDPFTGAYTLEVSSPGIDRPLRTKEHFQRFAGEEVVVCTAEFIDGRGKWTGILEGIEGEDVLLTVDGQSTKIPFEQIKSAHVKGRIEFNEKRALELLPDDDANE